MTDRELLELAAKAIGERVPPRFYPDGSAVFLSGQRWNPLTRDGDAFRLAVKLRLWVGVDTQATYVADVDFEVAAATTSESHGDDPYAATRRAIVSAAAEIGRALP